MVLVGLRLEAMWVSGDGGDGWWWVGGDRAGGGLWERRRDRECERRGWVI
jgi:hypothetical protein